MPESTVANSLIGLLDTVAGVRGRREADGAKVAETQSRLLLNEEARRTLDDENDRRTFGEAYQSGYITLSEDGKSFNVTPENAARMIEEAPDLLERLTGREANPFFSTKGPNGSEDITYAGLKRVDIPQQAPGIGEQEQPVPQVRYSVQLRKSDGTLVPATHNASSAPDDTLITLTADDVASKLNRRVARMQVAGAASSDPVLQSLRMDYAAAVDAEKRAALLAAAPDALGDEPVGRREFLGMIDTLEGEDLRSALADVGLDPDKLESDASAKWAKQQAEDRLNATKTYANNSEDWTAYEGTKEIFAGQLTRAEKALADYDAAKQASDKASYVDEESIRSGYPTLKGWGGQRPTADAKLNPKDPMNRTGKGGATTTVRDKLVAERDAAAKALTNLKPPPRPTMVSKMPVTKFAFTDDNLRASVEGKLDAPTAEQAAALTKYAKEQKVTKAEDLKKLPKHDAMALAWVIASATPGTTTEKMSVFESLANFARTGDTAKSPIDAEVKIAGALNETAQVGINQQVADTGVENAITNRMRLDYDWKKDARDYSLELQKLGYTRTKDLDTALEKMQSKVSVIRNAAVSPDPANPQSGDIVIKPTGPTKEMNAAMTEIRSGMMDAAVGSPMQIAASKAYLDALGVYAASVAAKTGDPAFWDFEKKFTNFFMREGAVLPIDSMIANIQFDGYVNGVPSKFRILENGKGSKSTEAMAGADTIDRFLGAGTFKALEQAATSQAAVNRLQEEGTQVDETTLPAMIATIRKENGAK